MKKRYFIIAYICILALIALIIYIYMNNALNIAQEPLNNSISKEPKTTRILENPENDSIKVIFESQKIQDDKTITISAIGDIMCHNTQFKDAYSNGSYDFSYVFSDVESYIKNADIAIGNLETTFAGSAKGYGGYPAFNTPEALANDLAELGLDVITTSNNHCLDTGYTGLESTLNFLDSAGLSHVGTARSFNEQNSILIKNVNDIKIAFLSYTYGTNGVPIPEDKNYCVNLINKDFILSQLQNAKKEKVDLICVSMHWGDEYSNTSNSEQADLTNFLFENGVDIILGSHPHVLQPMEIRDITLQDGTKKTGFVIYSLGNFMSGQTKENTKSSIILNLKLTKSGKTSKFSIDEILYTPIYTYTSPAYKNYKVLDIQKTINNFVQKTDTSISTNTYTLLQSELDRINSIYIK